MKKKKKTSFKTIPIIDLFAGPGGLGEGFMSLKNNKGEEGESKRYNSWGLKLPIPGKHYNSGLATPMTLGEQRATNNKKIS